MVYEWKWWRFCSGLMVGCLFLFMWEDDDVSLCMMLKGWWFNGNGYVVRKIELKVGVVVVWWRWLLWKKWGGRIHCYVWFFFFLFWLILCYYRIRIRISIKCPLIKFGRGLCELNMVYDGWRTSLLILICLNVQIIFLFIFWFTIIMRFFPFCTCWLFYDFFVLLWFFGQK
jgi:hypothetical protein